MAEEGQKGKFLLMLAKSAPQDTFSAARIGGKLSKAALKDWIVEALNDLGGSGRVVEIAERIWKRHEADLKASGDLFYTWQYAMRWAAQELQHEGKLSKAGKNRTWLLTP